MMASTSRDKMPVLPRGWSRHASNSCPGRFYFFNTETGAKTWDIRDIISGKDLPKEASTKDINELSIDELEKLLEEKKKRECMENQSTSKRKSLDSIDNKRKNEGSDILNPKRKKIAFDLQKNQCSPSRIKSPQGKETVGKKTNSGRSKWDRGADRSKSSEDDDSFDLDNLTKSNNFISPQRMKSSPQLSITPNESSSPKRIRRSESIETSIQKGIKNLNIS